MLQLAAVRRSTRVRFVVRAMAIHILAIGCLIAGCGSGDSRGPTGACDARFLVFGNRCGDGGSARSYLLSTAAPDTFEEWKALRCLRDEDPQLELGYFNDEDLRLGRGLHMTRCSSGVVAAYVSNFRTPGQTINDGLHAMEFEASPTAVAMDYVPSRGAGYEVQFYIYQDGRPVTSLQFDSEPAKLSPFACTTCHGGSYDPERGLVRGASLLPILKEANYFDFSFDAEREETLRQMNELIGATTAERGIHMLIEAAYPAGVGLPGARYQKGQVPESWRDNAELYTRVVRPYCIGCHAAHPFPSFLAASDVTPATMAFAVCAADAPMPQSQEGRTRFVTDPAARALLGCE